MSCWECRHAMDEPWVRGKTALRCMHRGQRQGRVVEIYPAGEKIIIRSRPSPAWCPVSFPAGEKGEKGDYRGMREKRER